VPSACEFAARRRECAVNAETKIVVLWSLVVVSLCDRFDEFVESLSNSSCALYRTR